MVHGAEIKYSPTSTMYVNLSWRIFRPTEGTLGLFVKACIFQMYHNF